MPPVSLPETSTLRAQKPSLKPFGLIRPLDKSLRVHEILKVPSSAVASTQYRSRDRYCLSKPSKAVPSSSPSSTCLSPVSRTRPICHPGWLFPKALVPGMLFQRVAHQLPSPAYCRYRLAVSLFDENQGIHELYQL